MINVVVFLVTLLATINCFPTSQQQEYPQTIQQYPAQQEVKPSQAISQLAAHHGYVYGQRQTVTNQNVKKILNSAQFQLPQLSQFPAQSIVSSTPAPTPTPTQLISGNIPLDVKKTAQTLFSDPDFQMLARSLQSGTGNMARNNPLSPREFAPCVSDGRSVTIDHLRISPESLVQIARLAQAFGSNPDWKKLRLADMKSALDNQMHPTHQYSARSIGL